ncbi:MAG: hypothetical protein HYX78_06685 [Armatimonadetes bacterium]|nr:hypothetical protein [Armatimonadota bacterium]
MIRIRPLWMLLFCASLVAGAAFGATITVTDDGLFTTDSTSLHAIWSVPPGTEVLEYEYAIGTSPSDPGSGYIVNWTSTGTATSATAGSLSLQNGLVYYIYVRGSDNSTNWVHSGVSNGIRMVAPVETPARAKELPDGAWVQLTARASATSGNLPNKFYVQSADRASGIQISSPGKLYPAVVRGKNVEVYGQMTTINGERAIAPAQILASGSESEIAPIFMPNRNIGGGNFSYVPGQSGQAGVMYGSGLNNLGILLRTVGKVTYVEPYDSLRPLDQFIYIDDGSALSDGSSHTGLKVRLNGCPAPDPDSPVLVTGLSSTDPGAPPIRVLDVRDQNDLLWDGQGIHLRVNNDKPLVTLTGARNGAYRVTVPDQVSSSLVITLTSSTPTVALLAPYNQAVVGSQSIQVTIPAGSTQSESFDVIGVPMAGPSGVIVGSAIITASADPASGYDAGVAPVHVIRSTFAWDAGDEHWVQAPIQFALKIVDPADPTVGYRAAQAITAFVDGDDPGVLGSTMVTIQDNQSSVSGSLPVEGAGTSTVNAWPLAGEVATAVFGPITVTQPALSLSSATPATGTGIRRDYYVTTPSPAPDDITVTVSSQDTGIAQVAPYGQAPGAVQVTIPKGATASGNFDVIGVASAGSAGAVAGTTNLVLTAGWAVNSVPVTVYQTDFQIAMNQTFVKTSGNAPFTVKAGWGSVYGYRLAQQTAVDITSSNTAVLGNALVTIPDNGSSVNGLSPIVDVGQATLTASTIDANILSGVGPNVTVTGTSLSFNNTTMNTGTGVKTGYFYVRVSQAPSSPITVTVTSNDPSVALLAPYNSSASAGSPSITVTINAGLTYSTYFDVIGVASGGTAGTLVASTMLTATAEGVASGVANVYVYQTDFKLIVNTSQTVPNPASVTVQIGSPNALFYPQRAAQSTVVDITSSDLAVLGNTSVTIANNATSAAGSVSTNGVGQATLTASTASASILNRTSNPITVSLPSFTFSSTSMVAPTGCRNAYSVSIPLGGSQTVVTLTTNDPSVALLAPYNTTMAGQTSITLVMNPGATAYFDVIGVASGPTAGATVGTTTITATASGFADKSANVNAVQTEFKVTANASVNQGSKANYTVTAGYTSGSFNTFRVAHDLPLTITSSDPAVLEHGDPVTFTNNTTNYNSFYQGTGVLAVGPGTATLTVTTSAAPILQGVSNTVTVN